MRKPKKILSVLLSAAAVSTVCVIGVANNTNAVDIASLNSDSVFVKQQQSDTCTLASNVMLLRRAAMLKGDSDWQSITENSCSPYLWVGGMRFSYTYRNISVDCERIYGNSTETLKRLLEEHPEGIVAYDYDYPHAVLLTDYTNGKFYCSDPARCCGSGRIEADQSLVDTSDIEAYWYVTSDLPDVQIRKMENTSEISAYEVNAGSEVILIGSASDASGKCTYTYQYKKSEGRSWNTVISKTESTTASLIIDAAGEYDVRITVNDQSTSVDKYFKLKVCDKLVNTSKLNKIKTAYGSDITMNLSAEKGSGRYQYEINAKKPSGSDWVNLRKFNSSNVYVYHPWETGTYNIEIKAKDSLGNISSNTYSFNVYVDTLSNETTISSDALSYGQSVTFSFASKGGMGGYQYEVNAKKPGSKDWVNFRKSTGGTSYTYRPWEVGTYEFQVVSTDNRGKKSAKYFSINVTADKLVNNCGISVNEITYGESVVIDFAAAGGTGSYKYEVNAIKPSVGSWANVRKLNAGTSLTYRPWEKGTYSFSVKVRDLLGNEVTRYFSVTVK